MICVGSLSMIPFSTIALSIILLTGCATSFKATQTDPQTNLFATSYKIPSDGVNVNEEYKNEYSKTAYLKVEGINTPVVQNFYLESIKNTNKFNIIKTKSDLEEYVFTNNLEDRVSNVSDLVGLSNLEKYFGSFLIIEPYLEHYGGYEYLFRLKAFDPRTGKLLLRLENRTYPVSGLDQPLFYPVFNAFIEWIEGKEIQKGIKTMYEQQSQLE
jgi:hypothetical protein